MNRYFKNQIFTLLTLTLAFLFLPVEDVSAQKKAGQTKNRSDMGVQTVTNKKEKKKAAPEYWVSGTVTSPDGKPVVNALVSANEGTITMRTDANGNFRLKSRSGALMIEAEGFEPSTYEVINEKSDIAVVLTTVPFFSGYNNAVKLPLDIQEKQRYIVGAVSGISGEKLENTPELLVSNTLTGQALGLYAQMTVNGFGNNSANLFVRGHSRRGNNQAVVLVDGVERNIDMLLLEEIESVEVLKDATTKILYGSRAANGIILVTTKHGKMHTRKITGAYQSGAGLTRAYPSFLNSFQYATLYNEARQNDGLPAMYTPADLEGYRNSSGPNDMRYPDVNYYDYFLNESVSYQKATVEFSGGNENARYAFVAGYNGNTGLQKIGEQPTRDWFNIRGNLDMKLNDFIKAFVGIAGIFDINKRGTLSHATTFDRISTTRPNEFPLVIDSKYVPVDTLGFPGMGASFDRDDNLYNALRYGRFRENSVNGQLNLGLDFNLSDYLTEGLSAKMQLGFDNFFYGAETLNNSSAATYAQRWYYDPAIAKDTVKIYQLSTVSPASTTGSLGNSYNLRGTSYLLGLDYERTFNDLHRFSANIRYHYMMYESSSQVNSANNANTSITPDIKNANTALRVNYTLKDRYIAELDLAQMGSNVFPKKNRYFMSYAGGLGWVISEEDFLKDAGAINFLKMKASAGLLGYDKATAADLYFTRWGEGANFQVRQGNNIAITELRNWASPNLKWEKSQEFNVGFEGLFFNRKLWAEANYFNELRSDIITVANSQFSAVYGNLFGQQNIEKVRNQGVELELKYMSNAGEVFYSVGFNGMWTKNKLLATNDVSPEGVDRSLIGRPSDITLGYVALGIFGKDVDLEGAPFQTLGDYGIGDIAYKDLNGDNIIDENDRKALGNSIPRLTFGIPVGVSYKGFGMNVLGVASVGVQDVIGNGYYWNFGNNKWSDIALDRYHPVNNPAGTYPRLTTTQGNNNFVNSTFWLHNLNFFRIKNAEVSYTFGYDQPLTSWLKTAKVFLRGTNILTISKFKDFDPEVPTAGLSNYPLFSVYTAGVSVTF